MVQINYVDWLKRAIMTRISNGPPLSESDHVFINALKKNVELVDVVEARGCAEDSGHGTCNGPMRCEFHQENRPSEAMADTLDKALAMTEFLKQQLHTSEKARGEALAELNALKDGMGVKNRWHSLSERPPFRTPILYFFLREGYYYNYVGMWDGSTYVVWDQNIAFFDETSSDAQWQLIQRS
jgi:hypothetical protein